MTTRQQSTVRIRTSHGFFLAEKSLSRASLVVPTALASEHEKKLAHAFFVDAYSDTLLPIYVKCVASQHPGMPGQEYWLWVSPYSGRALAMPSNAAFICVEWSGPGNATLVGLPTVPTKREPEEPGLEGLFIVKRRLSTYIASIKKKDNQGNVYSDAFVFWRLK